MSIAWDRIKYDPLRALALVVGTALMGVVIWQAVSIGPWARDTLKETKAAAIETKMLAGKATPVIENADKFVEAGTKVLDTKSRLFDVEIANARQIGALNQRHINRSFELVNGSNASSYCPLGSVQVGLNLVGEPVCKIPGVLPELTAAIHNLGLAGEEFRKAGETVNEKVLPSTLRILATIEDLMKQPEWKEIAPEVLAMVKHWKGTGANIEQITADLRKMADNAANPKKKGLWLTLLGIVGRMIFGPAVQGLVQR